ncbi:MAG TPA: ABC-F family ATP-binding cassette domain-containing protein [Candidatus Saccharimonadales bacterium]|nr:ABC-F family ATP-binding cassette domain-containing protein [Candidatus Saccharimonadales bacterium]
MILSVDITEKSFGDKLLYDQLQFDIAEHEKVGLIGRNGIGKTTLFNIITGDDTDFQGEVVAGRNAVVVSSRQEHHGFEDKTALAYILGDLPEYARLSHIIETYPATMGDNPKKLETYSEALERFGQLGYYQVEDELARAFADYQLDETKMHAPMRELSGGQKRMVELIKIQRSRGHVALIDEPTNHMDYVAKQAFISWLQSTPEAVLVITHDRDVLGEVDKIIEVRDGRAYQFRGNYEQYLQVNKSQITSEVNEYDLTQRRIANLKADVVRFRRMKEKARDPGTIKRFKSLENKATTELRSLQETERPSFWIDQESAEQLNTKMTTAYKKYKAKNIRLDTRGNESSHSRLLIQVKDLSLGYDDAALFSDINFELRSGERLRLHGRNGAGKTTLVSSIMAQASHLPLPCNKFAGHILVERNIRIGRYEQEIDASYFDMTLAGAIEQVFRDKDLPVNSQAVKQQLSNYLFDPIADSGMRVADLSGGQKARFQLISMLANKPELLILDEPTNHLDLPSIEELENALLEYRGAVLYISHDSYFADKLRGEIVLLDRKNG